jgi:hypothetical protein
MAELNSGMFRDMAFVTYVWVFAVVGNTFDAPGTNSTSSKVRASRICIEKSLWQVTLGSFLFHVMPQKERGKHFFGSHL